MIMVGREAKKYFQGRYAQKFRAETVPVPDLCYRKLLSYADSFRELAKSMNRPVLEEGISKNSADRRDLLEEQKTWENRALISNSLCEIAQIMARLADELHCCRPMEDKFRHLLMHAMRAESIYADNFCYLTEKKDETQAISMTLSSDKKGGYQSSQVADMLSVLLKRNLKVSAASHYKVDSEPRQYVFMEKAKYVVLTGFCKVTREGEEISGDHYSILESERGRMTMLLSDGTGSGESASEDSERVLDLMEKLLEAGYQMESAVHMVNTAVFAGGREYSHPTLDICDLDLYRGSARFCKVGGAASFLKRGEQIREICQGNLPLGIFQEVTVEFLQEKIQNGDYLILVTDGVLDALNENGKEEEMLRMLSELGEVSPGEMAERILQTALCSDGGHVRDDMTVLVAGIWENGAEEV